MGSIQPFGLFWERSGTAKESSAAERQQGGGMEETAGRRDGGGNIKKLKCYLFFAKVAEGT